MLTIKNPGRTTEPAHELAGNRRRPGTLTALGQACHVAVHTVTVAVELGDAGMHSVKPLLGTAHRPARLLKRCVAELSHI